jgi:catechol 2,3-dioxygenase-like lactoylglutathione lyase family enzyme
VTPIELTEIVLDADEPRELGRFYHRLLGGELGDDDEHWVVLRFESMPTLAFAHEPLHRPPVWPARPDEPAMMLHLDFRVDDLVASVAHAVAAGAVEAEWQPQPHVRVMLDPAGHPFCLWVPPPT